MQESSNSDSDERSVTKLADNRDELVALLKAGYAVRPVAQASATIMEYSQGLGDLDRKLLVKLLTEQTSAINEGSLRCAEDMLSAQAHTLDSIFNYLARYAVNSEYVDNLDSMLKLALRAQSQCRTTWEALATIQNPPVMGYVRQANIAHGLQQVNNASPAEEGSPSTQKNPNLENKLLEEKDDKRLDSGTASTPGQADPSMATVGKIDGAKNS